MDNGRDDRGGWLIAPPAASRRHPRPAAPRSARARLTLILFGRRVRLTSFQSTMVTAPSWPPASTAAARVRTAGGPRQGHLSLGRDHPHLRELQPPSRPGSA